MTNAFIVAGDADRLAPALNAACQCITLDRARLERQWQASHGEAAQLIGARPGLVAGNVVFVDPQDTAAMDRTAALLRQALTSRAFVDHVAQHAPAIAQHAFDGSGGLLGLDFHLGGATPQLIEINTNPGGLLVNLELARVVVPCCEQVRGPVEQLVSGEVSLESVPRRVVEAFRAEWRHARGDQPLTTIAIVDDEPANQYLYPEFLLYQRLFEQAGLRALVADATTLRIQGDRLMAAGTPLDLVYNRVTDFYFREQHHAALREAFERGLAVITPNPVAHAHWADKRLLAWLRDETLLRAAGLDDAGRAHLLRAIPPTEIVVPDAAGDLWRRRKGLFFKPVDGYGSKAAYRGDKLTRTTFEHIVAGRYVAQAIAPTSSRHVSIDGETSELRVDVRNYVCEGTPMLRAARLYRGQTTNFRTPGGGFAPVLTLGAMGSTGPG